MLGFMRGALQGQRKEEEEDPMVFQPIGGRPAAPGGSGAAPSAGGGGVNGRASSPRPTGTSGGSGAQPQAPNPRQIEMLLSRVQTSSVAQDRRDALSELSMVPQLGTFLHTDNIAMLLNVLRMNHDDNEVVSSILELLVAITDDPPAGQKMSDETMFLRDGFLHEMMDAATLLTVLKSPQFWPKYHAVQLLTRLQEYDGSVLQRQLLECNGITSLIDVLNDDSNGGALRNEGLILVSSLTMTNTDIQSILAFNNCFDSLFAIIRDQGGATEGDVIVKDCLTIILNMLRRNKATQSLFREMGLSEHLSSVLLGSFEVQPLPMSSEIVHAAVMVVSGLVRGEDANGEGTAVRKSICQTKVPLALCSVALSKQLDSFASIEALRALALLAQGCKQFVDIVCNAKLQAPAAKGTNAAPVAPLSELTFLALYDTDTTRQASAMACLFAFLETSGMNVAMFLTRGFGNLTGVSGPAGNRTCGQVLSSAIFNHGVLMGATNVKPNVHTVYNAAWLLFHCVEIPQVADQLLGTAMGSTPGGGGAADGRRSTSPAVEGASTGLTMLPYYTKHVSSVIQQRQTDLATLGALMRPLLGWLRYSTKAVLIFLNDETLFHFFVGWSTQTRDPIHVQLLCGTAAVMAAAMCPEQLPPTVRMTRNSLFEELHSKMGYRRYADLFYNASTTPEWQHAPTSAAASPSPVIYEKKLIGLITEMHDYVQAILGSMPAAAASSPEQKESPQQSTADGTDAAAAVATTRQAESPDAAAGSATKEPIAEVTEEAGETANVNNGVKDALPPQQQGATQSLMMGAGATSSAAGARSSTPASIVIAQQPTGPTATAATAQSEAIMTILKLQEALEAKEEALVKAQQEANERLRQAEARYKKELDIALEKKQEGSAEAATTAAQNEELQRQLEEVKSTHERSLDLEQQNKAQLESRVAQLEAQIKAAEQEQQHGLVEKEHAIAVLKDELEMIQQDSSDLMILLGQMDEENEMLRTQVIDFSTIKKGPREGIESTDTSFQSTA